MTGLAKSQAQEETGQEVVGEAEREFGQRVRIERGDDEQVGPVAEFDVQNGVVALIALRQAIRQRLDKVGHPQRWVARDQRVRRSAEPVRSPRREPRVPRLASAENSGGVRTAATDPVTPRMIRGIGGPRPAYRPEGAPTIVARPRAARPRVHGFHEPIPQRLLKLVILATRQQQSLMGAAG